MKKISADIIVTNTTGPLYDGVVVYDENTGEIKELLESSESIDDVHRLTGVLVPGYINAHCHLELSHLRGVIPTGTGLIPFIKSVVALRDFPQEEIDAKIQEADHHMYEAGIVAVGDISNQLDTVSVKQASKMRYYTFVEMFDLLQEEQAQDSFSQYKAVFEGQVNIGDHKKSMVPHAPYSVSDNLWQLLSDQLVSGETVSIHNQELAAENHLFLDGTGEFLDFFNEMGIKIDDFKPIEKTSIHKALQWMNPDIRALFVHNTMTSAEDIQAAQSRISACFWATCPNANLYIENKLPDYQTFLNNNARLCIGTDSLSSNWQLSVFEEMKTIKKYQSFLDDLEIIKWATLHGAQALGYDDLGVMEIGKAPGLNLIDVDVIDHRFDLSRARSSRKII